jgi:hypothetical protein
MTTTDERVAELQQKVTALSEALQAVLRGGVSSVRQRQTPPMGLGGRSEALEILRTAGLAPPAE